MTFSEDMLIRRSQSQSLCSYAFTLSRPSKKDVHNWSLTAVFSFLSQCGELFSVFFSSAQHSMVMHGVITESFHWPFFSITKKALLSGEKPKSEKLSKPMAQRFSPPAQTPFAALRSSREAGELSWVDFKRDDSQSEVFYYAIFISSKTGLGGWSQWSMKMY